MPDKERVVHRKTSRTMKDYIRMASNPTEAELKEREDRLRTATELLNDMVAKFGPQWDAEDRERLCEWTKLLLNAEGSTSKLDLAETGKILGTAIANFDAMTVSNIITVIRTDPELMKNLGLDQLVGSGSTDNGWERMTSGEAMRRLKLSRTTLHRWKDDPDKGIKSDGHGWCLVDRRYLPNDRDSVQNAE
jgi:hypothetical protein